MLDSVYNEGEYLEKGNVLGFSDSWVPKDLSCIHYLLIPEMKN